MSVTEEELKTKAAAPRVTLDQVMENIASEKYLTEGLLTICVLVLQNGFTVTGESACADPANFDKDLGQRLAKTQAIGKIWPLMGYELKTKVYQESQPKKELTFVERMIEERDQLEERLVKLSKFISTEAYCKLVLDEQRDLLQQCGAMGEYKSVLERRLARQV